MNLSVKTTAAHQDLLASLPDRLASRWQLLSTMANEQAAFKAEDHLTALAALSDQDFSRHFYAEGTGEHTITGQALPHICSLCAKFFSAEAMTSHEVDWLYLSAA
ncbi:hypothetical protein WJX77_012310 [Trebouxia sp. C0004]